MANSLRSGVDSAPVISRHGRAGQVTLTVGIDPVLKDRLVATSLDTGMPLKELVALAVTDWLERT